MGKYVTGVVNKYTTGMPSDYSSATDALLSNSTKLSGASINVPAGKTVQTTPTTSSYTLQPNSGSTNVPAGTTYQTSPTVNLPKPAPLPAATISQAPVDNRPVDTTLTQVARTIVKQIESSLVIKDQHLEKELGIADFQRKQPIPTTAQQETISGNAITKLQEQKNPEKIDYTEYLKRGLNFGNEIDPTVAYSKTNAPSVRDLPEPVTMQQKIAQTIGQLLTMSAAQPFIESALTKIPEVAKLAETAKTSPWKVGYPLALAKSAITGGVFGAITKNKQSLATNVLETAGTFAAFTALAYPIQALFLPVVKQVAEVTVLPENIKGLVKDIGEQGGVTNTVFFKHPTNPNQFLKVEVNGRISVTPEGPTGSPILDNASIKVFERQPSLYSQLEDFITGKLKPGEPLPGFNPSEKPPESQTPTTQPSTQPTSSVSPEIAPTSTLTPQVAQEPTKNKYVPIGQNNALKKTTYKKENQSGTVLSDSGVTLTDGKIKPQLNSPEITSFASNIQEQIPSAKYINNATADELAKIRDDMKALRKEVKNTTQPSLTNGGMINSASQKDAVNLLDAITLQKLNKQIDRAISQAEDHASENLWRKHKIAEGDYPHSQPTSKPSPIKSPAKQTIASTQKKSKVGKSIEAKAIEQNLTDSFEGTAMYDPKTVKGQAEHVATLFNENLEQAKQIIRGELDLPKHINGGAFIAGAELYLKNNPNPQMLYELANSQLITGTSEAAQTLRFLQERVPDSATALAQSVKKAREAQAEKRGKSVKEEVKKIKSEIKSKTPKVTKQSWSDFVESVKCGY